MKQLLHSPPKVLKSKFKIGYSLLLQSVDCDFVKKSLMMEDIDNQIQLSAKKIETLQEECDGIFYDFSRIEHYVEWREKLPFSKNKSKHELTKKMKDAECLELFLELEKFDKRNALLKEIKTEMDTKQYAEGYIDRQLASIHHVLEQNGFHENPKKEIASMLHEVHPLVFTDLLIKYDFFNDYSTVDFFMLLSCFCEMKVQDSFQRLSPACLKDECMFMKTRMNNYLQEEWNHELSASGQNVIQYDLMEFIQQWMNCENEQESLSVLHEVKTKKGVFIGDFIKACLKMVNIAKELDRIERLDLREKLREGTNSLMKFICTHDSLYL
jgi:hypothetical protein